MTVLLMSTTLIDPLWGRRELMRFFLTVNVMVGILCTTHYILIYRSKGDAVYLYGVRIYGLTGYLAAVCVTVKQLLPHSVLFQSPVIGKFRHDHMPLSALILAYVLYLANLTSGVSVLTFFYGLVVSWCYLRYLQFHPTNDGHGTRGWCYLLHVFYDYPLITMSCLLTGDRSEAFSVATFFPNVLQPLVAILCNAVHSFLVRIHILSPHDSSQSATRVLSERLTDNFRSSGVGRSGTSTSGRTHHKYKSSGDYEYLQQQQMPGSGSSSGHRSFVVNANSAANATDDAVIPLVMTTTTSSSSSTHPLVQT